MTKNKTKLTNKLIQKRKANNNKAKTLRENMKIPREQNRQKPKHKQHHKTGKNKQQKQTKQ